MKHTYTETHTLELSDAEYGALRDLVAFHHSHHADAGVGKHWASILEGFDLENTQPKKVVGHNVYTSQGSEPLHFAGHVPSGKSATLSGDKLIVQDDPTPKGDGDWHFQFFYTGANGTKLKPADVATLEANGVKVIRGDHSERDYNLECIDCSMPFKGPRGSDCPNDKRHRVVLRPDDFFYLPVTKEEPKRANIGDVVQSKADSRIKFTVGYVGSEYAFESPAKQLGTWMVKHGEYTIVKRANEPQPKISKYGEEEKKPELTTIELVEMLKGRKGVRSIAIPEGSYYIERLSTGDDWQDFGPATILVVKENAE